MTFSLRTLSINVGLLALLFAVVRLAGAGGTTVLVGGLCLLILLNVLVRVWRGESLPFAYRAALACGALPLGLGISIFVLWLITRREELMVAGFGTIFLGTAVVGIGMFALACYCWRAFQVPGKSRRRIAILTSACAALLLVNFPAALGIVIAVGQIETAYEIPSRTPRKTPSPEYASPAAVATSLSAICDRGIGSRAPFGFNRMGNFACKRRGAIRCMMKSSTNMLHIV